MDEYKPLVERQKRVLEIKNELDYLKSVLTNYCEMKIKRAEIENIFAALNNYIDDWIRNN